MAGTAWRYEIHPFLSRLEIARPELGPELPLKRCLRAFSQDPSLARFDGAICVLKVPNEPLKPGPSGAWFEVIDPEADPPLDLEAPAWLMRDGLDPSTTDRRFACQMVYAVAMETYARFTDALGREPGFGPIQAPDGRLRLMPFAFEDANAYYSRDLGAIEFGYARAGEFAGQLASGIDGGRSQAGGNVFLALSRDVIAHEVSHALLDGLRPNFLRPTHPDVGALHEGFSDLVAIFLHFSHADIVARALRETQGSVASERLAEIGRQFGFDLIDGRNPLRTAVHFASLNAATIAPEHRYDPSKEVHALGAVLVSAVFEAFRRLYERKSSKLRRVFASYQGSLPNEAIELLTSVACSLAKQFLNIVIRAIDYCPSHHCTFGEYLRAMLTADRELVPDDPWGYREALISSFRRYGITVPDVPDLSEDALLWKSPAQPLNVDALRFERLGLRCVDGLLNWSDNRRRLTAADALAQAVCNDARGAGFGLLKPGGKIEQPRLISLRTLRRVSPDGNVNFDLVAEIVQKRTVREGFFFGGATLVIGADGHIRYAIYKHLDSERRLRDQRAWLETQDEETRAAAWDEHSAVAARLQVHLHAERFR
jgi:hypothetical protein